MNPNPNNVTPITDKQPPVRDSDAVVISRSGFDFIKSPATKQKSIW